MAPPSQAGSASSSAGFQCAGSIETLVTRFYISVVPLYPILMIGFKISGIVSIPLQYTTLVILEDPFDTRVSE